MALYRNSSCTCIQIQISVKNLTWLFLSRHYKNIHFAHHLTKIKGKYSFLICLSSPELSLIPIQVKCDRSKCWYFCFYFIYPSSCNGPAIVVLHGSHDEVWLRSQWTLSVHPKSFHNRLKSPCTSQWELGGDLKRLWNDLRWLPVVILIVSTSCRNFSREI